MKVSLQKSEEFTKKIQEIINEHGEDIEDLHSNLDKLMEKTLSELGFEIGVLLIQKQKRWYA